MAYLFHRKGGFYCGLNVKVAFVNDGSLNKYIKHYCGPKGLEFVSHSSSSLVCKYTTTFSRAMLDLTSITTFFPFKFSLYQKKKRKKERKKERVLYISIASIYGVCLILRPMLMEVFDELFLFLISL